jgi:hypothetical protein
MKTASKLWDLLHEVAPYIPVSNVDLHEQVQSVLDEGTGVREDFGISTTSWRIDEWDGIQVKWQTLKRRCGKKQAERLQKQYEYAGKKVRLVEVTQYETELSSKST